MLAAILVGPLWAASRVSGPRSLFLDFGPGDDPFVQGFTPEWEVDDNVGTHWTTYEAAAVLPLEVRGPLRLTLRYARVLPQTALVDVVVAGRPVKRFACRGGVWEERVLDVGSVDAGPARVELHVDSHDRRNLGLRLDWMRLEVGGSRLLGGARLRPAATIALTALLFLALGWPIARALGGVVPVAIAVTILLLRDTWLTHRLLACVPEVLAAWVLVVLAVRAFPRFRAGCSPAMRWAGSVAACVFLLRAAAVNHPSFYYPDLLVHARLVGVVRAAGVGFVLAPSRLLWGVPGAETPEGRGPSGLWLKHIGGGRPYGLPYSLAFHAPFALFEGSPGQRIGWLKVWGAFLSVVPILALGALTRLWGLSRLATLAVVFIPTYVSRLTLGLLPALFGHAFEMLLLVWLARRPAGRLTVGGIATGGFLLAACQLAYFSASAHLMVAVLAAGFLFASDRDARWRGGGFLVMLVTAIAISLVAYYRDFLSPWLPGGGGLAGVGGAFSRSGLENPLVRMQAVFGTTFVLAGFAGAFVLRRVAPARAMLGGWALVGGLLLVARSLAPVMRFGHEELWLAPLLCLAAAEAVAWSWSRGPWGRASAVLVGLALATEGAWLQWRALTARLH